MLTIDAGNRNARREEIRANFDANFPGKQRNDFDIIIATEVLAEGGESSPFKRHRELRYAVELHPPHAAHRACKPHWIAGHARLHLQFLPHDPRG